jgi:hypothetical protein
MYCWVNTATATDIGSGNGNFNIRTCIVPNYISEIPVDPSSGAFVTTDELYNWLSNSSGCRNKTNYSCRASCGIRAKHQFDTVTAEFDKQLT